MRSVCCASNFCTFSKLTEISYNSFWDIPLILSVVSLEAVLLGSFLLTSVLVVIGESLLLISKATASNVLSDKLHSEAANMGELGLLLGEPVHGSSITHLGFAGVSVLQVVGLV